MAKCGWKARPYEISLRDTWKIKIWTVKRVHKLNDLCNIFRVSALGRNPMQTCADTVV